MQSVSDTFTLFPSLSLRINEVHVLQFILEQFLLLHRLYLRDREMIPEGSLYEVPFALLDKEPRRVVREIYARFGLPGHEEVSQAVEGYLEELGAFKKNDHKRLTEEMKEFVGREWREGFEAFGYEL